MQIVFQDPFGSLNPRQTRRRTCSASRCACTALVPREASANAE